MSNIEHIKMLQTGSENWNNWREKNPDIIPDLSEIDLSYTNLAQANFTAADLREANLSEANLFGVDFREANLTYASLSKFDIFRMNLIGFGFNDEFLTGSDFLESRITGGDLIKVDNIGIEFIEEIDDTDDGHCFISPDLTNNKHELNDEIIFSNEEKVLAIYFLDQHQNEENIISKDLRFNHSN